MTQTLSCTCGQVRLAVETAPIASVECCCTSCREASARLARLPRRAAGVHLLAQLLDAGHLRRRNG